MRRAPSESKIEKALEEVLLGEMMWRGGEEVERLEWRESWLAPIAASGVSPSTPLPQYVNLDM